mgnify:FL=1
MARQTDPEPKRCGTCDRRLSRTEPNHEENCIRRAQGMPPYQDEDGADLAPRSTDCPHCGGWRWHDKWCRSVLRLPEEARRGR